MNRFSKNESGSIALEYIILLSLVIPFELFTLSIFNYHTGYTDAGWLLMQFFQRILAGISLPIP